MVDKIIEELVGIKSDITSTNEVLSLVTRTRNTALEEAIEIVKKYENDGWVSVNDRLPDEYTEVWATMKGLALKNNSTFHLFYSDRMFRHSNFCGEKFSGQIIAWKPFELPQPYKGE